MPKWTFEPGHSAAEFCVRHMMVTWVRGHFKNVQGTLDFDPERPENSSVEAVIDVNELWTGVPERDTHLKSSDFFDLENHSEITFKSSLFEVMCKNEFKVIGDLTMRGVSKEIDLDVFYHGEWSTPFWVNDKNKGPIQRAGFTARTKVNRHDFGISWNDDMERGGKVVGNEASLTLDVEALLEK